jgi:methionyl-tRNA formyltransferase
LSLPDATGHAPEARRLVFLGSKGSGLRLLRAIREVAPDALAGVITIDDRMDSRSALDEYRAFGRDGSVPLEVAADRHQANALLLQLKPDLCVVMGWYWLIPAPVLESVPRGCVGIHYSLLPRYRGSAPLVWAILNGESETGYSIFSFTPGMDDGPIWAQGRVPIGPDDYIADVLARLDDESVTAFRRILPGMLDGSLVPRPQPTEGASYCGRRTPEDGRIDWHRPARELYDFIRAQSRPYPGAFTTFHGTRVHVWRARLDARPAGNASPGEVVRVEGGTPCVAAGDGRALVLEELEMPSGVATPSWTPSLRIGI